MIYYATKLCGIHIYIFIIYCYIKYYILGQDKMSTHHSDVLRNINCNLNIILSINRYRYSIRHTSQYTIIDQRDNLFWPSINIYICYFMSNIHTKFCQLNGITII